MTKLICILVIFFGLPGFSSSQPYRDWTEDYGVQGEDPMLPADDHDYDWLYEKIMPEELRKISPNETFKSFRVHLYDTYKKFPDPSMIAANNLRAVKDIKGSITYAGFVKKTYTYDVLQSSKGETIFRVRVFLKTDRASDWMQFEQKMQGAQDIWNAGRIQADFPYGFQFELTTKSSEAHFSVYVQDSTRGPYDTTWGRDWTANTIAHEVGHMMGLGDEYQTISGNMDCHRPSLMCSAWYGRPMFHHYYFLLRRMVKN